MREVALLWVKASTCTCSTSQVSQFYSHSLTCCPHPPSPCNGISYSLVHSHTDDTVGPWHAISEGFNRSITCPLSLSTTEEWFNKTVSQSTLYSTPGKCSFDVTEPCVIYNMIINRRHHEGESLEVSLVKPIVLSLLLFIDVLPPPPPSWLMKWI